MQAKQLSLCYFPTKVVIVDDNIDFINSISSGLTDLIKTENFDDPKKALNYLSNDYKGTTYLERCIQADEDAHVDHMVIDLNVRSIHKEIYNPQRFAEISVLVVDYAMPGMDGLELCEKINNKNLKIIMLTGEADYELAVTAFNEGIIHKFIKKSTPKLTQQLSKEIAMLQKEYFVDLTNQMLSQITKKNSAILKCLTDPKFVSFFESLCGDKKICEYYLMDNYGSFLLIDRKGKQSCLAVKDETEMEECYRFVDFEKAPDGVVRALKNRQKIPYFHTEKDLQTPPAAWADYMHPATKLSGDQIYYYAYLTEKDIDLSHDKVHTYSQRIL